MQKTRKHSIIKRIKRYSLLILLLAILLTITIAPLRRSVNDAINQLLINTKTTVENISLSLHLTLQALHITGLDYTTENLLLKHLNLEFGSNLLTIDTLDLARRVQNIGWIQDIAIYIRLPNTLEIRITEHTPYALWQNNGDIHVITENGTIIPAASPKNFGALPLVIGPSANVCCKYILNIFADYPNLKDKLSAIQYMHARRWRLHLSSGIIIDLPEDNIGDTLHKLHITHQQQKILDRDVKIIDMRIKDRIIIKGSSVVGQQKS